MDRGKEPELWHLGQSLKKRGLAKILEASALTRWEEGLVQPHKLLAKKAFYS